MNLFEMATRNALRFPSPRGLVDTEQLWKIPLKAKDGFDLDTIAQNLHAEVEKAGRTSFVSDDVNPEGTRAAMALDVVKHIIAVKKAEAAEREGASLKKAQREVLLAEMAKRDELELSSLSKEELQKRLEALEA